jgi:hypothetical protein
MSITPGLFDDDPVTPAAGASLVRRSPAFGTSRKGKNVARLLAQIESLREAFTREKRRLEDALVFHAAHVRPREERVAALRTDAVRALARFLNDRRLGKADARVLRVILTEQIEEILARVATPAPDIVELFERLHGVSFEEVVQADLDEARSELADVFDALGLDMDVPDLRPGMTEAEMAASAAEMADRMRRLHEAKVEQAPSGRKTKRQVRADQRAEQREQLRKISLGSVYKRLVKALHPDLEPDPRERQRKIALMQDVTTAYAQQDLHSLLRLELECIRGEASDAERRTDETLHAYAAFLREQVARLRADTADLPFHPRYEAIVVEDAFGWGHLLDGPAESRRLDEVIEALTAGIERLTDESLALRQVRELIREHRQVRGGRRRRQ